MILEEIFREQADEEDALRFRNPWFDVFYRYLLFLLILLLFVSFLAWGLDIHTRKKAEAMTATALASWQAEQDAIETAKAEKLAAVRASQEYVMQQEATVVAKAFFGIRLFVDKYHYSTTDLETYARCMFNRAEASGDLIGVVSAKDQFVGYSDGNTVLTENYDLALKLVEQWHNETTKPCDSSFQFAELTPDGIWLKQDIRADGYARRWRAA